MRHRISVFEKEATINIQKRPLGRFYICKNPIVKKAKMQYNKEKVIEKRKAFHMKKPQLCRLQTPFENSSTNPWHEYPRPQMVRERYFSLCGTWQISILSKEEKTPIGEIQVPFPPESAISGIERTLEENECYLYEKTFVVNTDFFKDTTLLHFGAVDQIAEITLNDIPVGKHIGGYLPFTLDITNAIRIGENTLQVKVIDTLDTDIPYGKQRKKRGGMWYTPISGIWQPVWMESVPLSYIRAIRMTPTLNDITIEVDGGANEKILSIETPNGILHHHFVGDQTTVKIDNPIHWTPENPYLYHVTLTSGDDSIRSYFALRTVSIQTVNGKSYITLNGKPYLFHGLLDQGYYSDGIYLPASPEGYRFDIQTMKSLGFNMLRKHIKIEPDIFYYECDRLGMIVFQDMVNNGKYHFLIDTALPTIGLKKGISHRATKRRRSLFESQAKETLSHLYNHPCVCYYTIFNEGWGQYDADRLYDELKAMDPTRIFDSTSGWFTENKSDVKSEHIYFKKIRLAESEKPLVLSEFGGYSHKVNGHSFNLEQNYGYRFFEKQADFMDALESLYRKEILPMIQEKGLCAMVLTQVSDVEDETNGLLTYDRQVLKVDENRMKAIANDLFQSFKSTSAL